MSRRPATAVKGPDIPAIALLSAELGAIQRIRDPPSEYSGGKKYKQEVEEIINKALDTTQEVNDYARKINEKLDEMREALKKTTTKVQEAIMKALNSIVYTDNPRGQPVPLMQYVNELMQLEVTKKRLEEAMVQTQITVEKLQNNVLCTESDIDALKGCIKSWQQAKRQSHEDEKRQEEERRRRLEEEQNRRREEEERRRREEEERTQREEEERKRREEEERQRREEEERKRAEEERKRKEEEERKKKEEEERLRREEEERKAREEEEMRRRRLEEEERLKREEAERLEATRKERERLRLEEEERRRRLDPNNWKPIIYTRQNVEADGQRSHHQGINCVVTAVPGALQDDDIQCLASDEDRDILPALADGEKILSSVIELESRKGPISCEAPIRTFIPHQPVPDASDELLVKVSVNGSDWLMTNSVGLPSTNLTDKNIRLMGVELDNFETAKLVVVARPKSQNLIIDKSGTSQYSAYDKNVKLFVPRDAFKKPTEVKFSVKTVPDDVLSTIENGSDCIEPIITTGPLVSLACQSPPTKDIEIDLLKSSDSVSSSKPIKGKSYQLYKTSKTPWQIADVEFKGRGKDMSISLPASKTHYSIIEVEVPQNTPKEEVAKMAGALYDCMNKSVVRLIAKQREENPEHLMIQCLRREIINERLKELINLGYTAGPDTSREFYLADGQKLQVFCSGNIEPAAPTKNMVKMPFYAYMDTAKQEIMIQVKDKYKQRDLPEYMGNLHCQVLPVSCNTSDDTNVSCELDIELPLSLPKREHIPLLIKTAPLRFPHHLSALTMFLSWKLAGSGHTEHGVDWFSVLCELGGGKRKMQTHRNYAKNKCTDPGDQSLCRIMLEDWMKATNVSDDKLGPIVSVLNHFGMHSLGQECEELVEYHRVTLSDAVMHDISDKVSDDPRTFGEKLGLSEDTIKKSISENSASETLQVISMLMEWRQSQSAVEKGTKALEFLTALVRP